MQLRATVRGYVQGVGFRYFVQRKARGLMLKGYVQNRQDGTVYLVAAGERPALEQLLSSLHEGPSQARVSAVDVEWSDESTTDLPPTFEVRH